MSRNMLPLDIADFDDSRPLTAQIVARVAAFIEDGSLRPGARLPSIRRLAQQLQVSPFTVAQAYDRLVAGGELISRLGAGFFVAERQRSVIVETARIPALPVAGEFEVGRECLHTEASSLPHSWLDTTGLRRAMRSIAASKQADRLLGSVTDPQGHLPLRTAISEYIAAEHVFAGPEEMIVTSGATDAFDLIVRGFIRPGDSVLVDDPGYFGLFRLLRSWGANVIGVPRDVDGPDMEELERLATLHRPKLFFTNSRLHNPTGASIARRVAFEVLRIADSTGMTIVEDDVYGDFDAGSGCVLAGLGGIDRVIYVRSFSKSMSPALRVGFVAARGDVIATLLECKLHSSRANSLPEQRIIYEMLVSGSHRRNLKRLRVLIGEASARAQRTLGEIGFTLASASPFSLFLWARHDGRPDARAILRDAGAARTSLAPGDLFSVEQESSEWIRVNISAAEHLGALSKAVCNQARCLAPAAVAG